MSKLTIMIPTYNRADFLHKNVKQLCGMIRENKLTDRVCISVSDNASTDHTAVVMGKIKAEEKDIHVEYLCREENVGISENLMGLLEKTKTEFAMVLGDDDFIEVNYLLEVMEKIQNDDNINCVLPSYQNVTVDGEKMNRSRDIGKKPKRAKKGFYNCFLNSWRAHQLSGLVFKVDDLYQKSREVGLNNLYLFVYWIAESCLRGDTLHLTTYPVKVTRPAQAAKAWSYGKDGLIGEFFQNYKLLGHINYVQRSLLELKFLYVQYWRYAMYLKVGLLDFFKCIGSVIKSENTTYITKVLFIIYIPIVGICQSFRLLFSGKIIDTLSTKVEV